MAVCTAKKIKSSAIDLLNCTIFRPPACHMPVGHSILQQSILFFFLFYFYNSSPRPLGSLHQTSREDAWCAGIERFFQIFDFLSWGSRGPKVHVFGLFDLRLLTAFNIGSLGPRSPWPPLQLHPPPR